MNSRPFSRSKTPEKIDYTHIRTDICECLLGILCRLSLFRAAFSFFFVMPSSKFCTHIDIIASEIVSQALNMSANSFQCNLKDFYTFHPHKRMDLLCTNVWFSKRHKAHLFVSLSLSFSITFFSIYFICYIHSINFAVIGYDSIEYICVCVVFLFLLIADAFSNDTTLSPLDFVWERAVTATRTTQQH